jgi:hypothetical protein
VLVEAHAQSWVFPFKYINYQTILSKTPIQKLKWYLSEQNKKEYMIYATQHNSFTNQYLWNIHLLQILQIMYNKCVKNYVVKFSVRTFLLLSFVICLMYVQASPPMSSNWIMPLCDNSWGTQKCTGPHQISRTSPLPTCRTNVAVHSFVWIGWPVMSIGLL